MGIEVVECVSMNISLNQFEQEIKHEFCSMCGALNGDFWETRPKRHVLLRRRPRFGDTTQFWMICDECDEGLQKTTPPKPDRIHLLSQIRRATIPDQEAVLSWLLQKFNLAATKKND